MRNRPLWILSVLVFAGCASDPVVEARSPEQEPEPVTPRASTEVSPGPSAEQIRAVIEGNFDMFRQCYVVGMMRDSQLAGRIETRFSIATDGSVDDTEILGNDTGDEEFGACVAQSFTKLTFSPAPGSPLDVEYPLTFGRQAAQ